MRIIAIEKKVGTPAREAFLPHLEAEARRVLELQQADLLREIYFRADRREAVLILESRDAAHAREVLDSLPLVQAGLIDFEIIPLAPYTGFGRLIEGDMQ